MTQLVRIISGGQTGADQAGLIAAKMVGLETGGWMPKGFRTLGGDRPEFAALYDIQEHFSRQYPPRTYQNVFESDATVRFAADFASAGERCTLKAIKEADKLYFDINIIDSSDRQSASAFAAWLTTNQVKTLNVAGNSEKTAPGIQEFVITYLMKTFHHLDIGPKSKVYTTADLELAVQALKDGLAAATRVAGRPLTIDEEHLCRKAMTTALRTITGHKFGTVRLMGEG